MFSVPFSAVNNTNLNFQTKKKKYLYSGGQKNGLIELPFTFQK